MCAVYEKYMNVQSAQQRRKCGKGQARRGLKGYWLSISKHGETEDNGGRTPAAPADLMDLEDLVDQEEIANACKETMTTQIDGTETSK